MTLTSQLSKQICFIRSLQERAGPEDSHQPHSDQNVQILPDNIYRLLPTSGKFSRSYPRSCSSCPFTRNGHLTGPGHRELANLWQGTVRCVRQCGQRTERQSWIQFAKVKLSQVPALLGSLL
jgi:hypothetical protein